MALWDVSYSDYKAARCFLVRLPHLDTRMFPMPPTEVGQSYAAILPIFATYLGCCLTVETQPRLRVPLIVSAPQPAWPDSNWEIKKTENSQPYCIWTLDIWPQSCP